MKNISGMTLEQLENEDWGDPPYPSHLVTECHRLRRVPLGEFTTENLRIMIGQSIGLEYLIPLALDILREDPFASGDFYKGDLLCSVISCDAVKNDEIRGLCQELRSICRSALAELPRIAREESTDWLDGKSPEEFGLDQDAIDNIVEAEIEKLRNQTPWRTFRAFAGSDS